MARVNCSKQTGILRPLAFVLILSPALSAAEEPQIIDPGIPAQHFDSGTRTISIVGEKGATLPPILLFELAGHHDVAYRIHSGMAGFIVNESVVQVHSESTNRVLLPPILLAQGASDSRISITIDGIALGREIRLGAVKRGAIARIPENPIYDGAILYLADDRRLVIADEDLIRWGEALGGPTSSLRSLPEPPGAKDQLVWCSPEEWQYPELTDEFPVTTCPLTNVLDGLVVWQIPDPRGAGFSVKGEDSYGTLLWAVPPSQLVDGIYKRSWGCGKALKVADACLLQARVTTAACCCVAAELDFTCEWINPTPLPDWPDCPKQ